MTGNETPAPFLAVVCKDVLVYTVVFNLSVCVCLCVCVCVCVCVLAEMFFSMGPGGGMTSSVTSMRSGSELSDSDMESSTHSLASFTQPAQVQPLCVFTVLSII